MRRYLRVEAVMVGREGAGRGRVAAVACRHRFMLSARLPQIACQSLTVSWPAAIPLHAAPATSPPDTAWVCTACWLGAPVSRHRDRWVWHSTPFLLPAARPALLPRLPRLTYGCTALAPLQALPAPLTSRSEACMTCLQRCRGCGRASSLPAASPPPQHQREMSQRFHSRQP